VVRVILGLDGAQLVIVIAIESLLEVGLVEVGLESIDG
jgi:hypothetical protein